MNWRKLLRRGFGGFAAVIATVLLLLLGLVIVLFSEAAYDQQQEREAGVQAQIVSASVAPALAFLDDESAQRYLEALSANPAVAAAAVYDVGGGRIAHYSRAGAEPAPIQAPAANSAASGAKISVMPVVANGERLGQVYLRIDALTAVQRFARYAGFAVLLVLASLVFIVFGIAQAALKQANEELEERAAQLQQEIHQRERAEEELLQSRKMEAIGQLVGGVAHDFNNLLTVVLSGLRLMERNPDPARQAITTEAMRQAVERGAGLTRQLLAFARRQALKPEVVDIGARLAGMRELLERSLRADILVDIQAPSDLWPVKSDPTQLELAIINLAVNARDAMPKGGVLTISAENMTGESGEHVAIRIRDTGHGMSEETRKRVFEPYFTTKAAGQGTGLGLAQVYGIVTQSGGTVSIESTIDVGTTILLCLPRSLELPEAPTAAPAESAQLALGGAKLLVVEDDDSVAQVVMAMAADLGCAPLRVASAAAALSVLSEGRQFDLVFSDIIMPGDMNGLELAQVIARRYPDLPIVLTTGFSGAADIGNQFPVLRKPYEPEEFQRLIATVLATPAAKSA
ncbi:ATP-binding protein [Terricaulis sp.]|uniref:ATP-binding protein n=1 Tax=Terricaulis sp. TaxID=2768686 RepID=UPI002AC3D16E|nr:ATP-binding protein [Terricaulis sp.]MDZ4690284.1 ATP-binding protein [Terricaulis sp.]